MALLSEIKQIRSEHKSIGVRQIQGRLKKNHASYGTIRRLCSENGLMTKRKPRCITRRDIEAIAASDLIERNFSAEQPGKKLLNDITEIGYLDGKLYMAATLDCFDGAIVGMAMDSYKKAELCVKSLESAAERFRNQFKSYYSQRPWQPVHQSTVQRLPRKA